MHEDRAWFVEVRTMTKFDNYVFKKIEASSTIIELPNFDKIF